MDCFLLIPLPGRPSAFLWSGPGDSAHIPRLMDALRLWNSCCKCRSDNPLSWLPSPACPRRNGRSEWPRGRPASERRQLLHELIKHLEFLIYVDTKGLEYPLASLLTISFFSFSGRKSNVFSIISLSFVVVSTRFPRRTLR